MDVLLCNGCTQKKELVKLTNSHFVFKIILIFKNVQTFEDNVLVSLTNYFFQCSEYYIWQIEDKIPYRRTVHHKQTRHPMNKTSDLTSHLEQYFRKSPKFSVFFLFTNFRDLYLV